MNKKSQEDIFLRQNIKLIESERREIAYELHNDIGQHLTAIRIAAQLIHRQSEGRQTHPVAENIVTLTDELYQMVEQLLRKLHPSSLEKFGLHDALEDLTAFVGKNMQLQCQLVVEGDFSDVDKELELALYRIIQEALTNAARHGGASEARIQLTLNSDRVGISVLNNGAAVAGTMDELIHDRNSGIGLLGIKHRITAWQGEVQLENREKGVELTCSIPLVT